MLFSDFLCHLNKQFSISPTHEVGHETFLVSCPEPLESDVLKEYITKYLIQYGIKEERMKVFTDELSVAGLGLLEKGLVTIYSSYNPQDPKEIRITVTIMK